MTRKQLLALFIVNLSGFTVGTGTGTLYPIYAVRLGADPNLIGLYMSSVFAAIASGIMVAGWLADKFQRRKSILIIAGTMSVVTLWLLGQATNMGQLVLFSVISNILGGVQIAMINTLGGLFAGEAERGRVFGILTSAIPVGSLIGGLAAGPLVDQWEFTGLFTVAALVTILQPTVSLLLEDKRVVGLPLASNIASPIGALRSRAFLFLFMASIVAFVGSGVYGLGRALVMNNLGFDASAISSTLAASGLVTLPLPLVLGWLSDRIGRKSLLIVCYIASAASLITLAGASVLWHFWVSSAFQAVLTASLGIGAALVTDLVPGDTLGSGLSLFSATNWIGLIIGSAVTGAALQGAGTVSTLLLGVLLALGAVILIFPIRRPLVISLVSGSRLPVGQ